MSIWKTKQRGNNLLSFKLQSLIQPGQKTISIDDDCQELEKLIFGVQLRTVARKCSIGAFLFVQGGFDILKVDKNTNS